MAKILVTGASGFTAKHFIPFIQKNAEIDIVRLDINQIEDSPAHCTDMLNFDELHSVIANEKPNYIVNFASITRSDNYLDFYNGNVFTAINIFESLIKAKLLNTKVLLISSSAVYGENTGLLTEQSALYPINFYGTSKIIMEQEALKYARVNRIKVNIARTFNIIGPGQSTKFVIPSFAKQLVEIKKSKAEPVIQVGNLSSSRDFIDITDVVNAYWKILNLNVEGEIFNVCSSKPVFISEMLHKMTDLLKIEVKIEKDNSRIQKTDIPVQNADNTKLKNLGWLPGISVEQSLLKILNHLMNSRQG